MDSYTWTRFVCKNIKRYCNSCHFSIHFMLDMLLRFIAQFLEPWACRRKVKKKQEHRMCVALVLRPGKIFFPLVFKFCWIQMFYTAAFGVYRFFRRMNILWNWVTTLAQTHKHQTIAKSLDFVQKCEREREKMIWNCTGNSLIVCSDSSVTRICVVTNKWPRFNALNAINTS